MITNSNNIIREERLLSALRFEPTVIARSIAAGLTADYFSTDITRRMFTAISKLHADGESVDELSIGRLIPGDILVFADLYRILNCEPTWAHARQLTADVVAAGKRRGVGAVIAQAMEKITSASLNEPWDETWGSVATELQRAYLLAGGSGGKPSRSEAIEEAIGLLGPQQNNGLRGPFLAWDAIARRLGPGQSCVLAGNTGAGKSALACQYALAAISAGKACHYFSLEMSEPELLNRMGIQSARSNNEAAAAAGIRGLPQGLLFIDDKASVSTFAQIEAKAKLTAAVAPLALIIIDYLQLVVPPNELLRVNREQQVAFLSRSAKQLAGSLKVPALVLSQFNRAPATEGRPPQLHDLRESGSLEQDADAVWTLYREDQEDTSTTVAVTLTQLKRRNWKANVGLRLGFTGSTFSFAPLHENQP